MYHEDDYYTTKKPDDFSKNFPRGKKPKLFVILMSVANSGKHYRDVYIVPSANPWGCKEKHYMFTNGITLAGVDEHVIRKYLMESCGEYKLNRKMFAVHYATEKLYFPLRKKKK